MADVGKVMLLGLRKLQIEEDLKEAKVIVEAFKLVKYHLDEFDESMLYDLEKIIRKYDVKVEGLTKDLNDAETEWLEASEEYKKEKGAEA